MTSSNGAPPARAASTPSTWTARRQFTLSGRRHDRPGLRPAEHRPLHPETPGEGQQVADGHGTFGLDGVVERAVGAAQHPAPGQFRQEPVHRLVQAQPAVLDQAEDHHRRDRLGHRRDAEHGVFPHRRPVHRHGPGRRDVRLVPVSDRGHHPGRLPLRHCRLDDLL
jgi:hypothetical protein